MKNEYHPVGDMSYQEWRNIVDTQEDTVGSGKTVISYKEEPEGLEERVILFYGHMIKWGDKNHLLEFELFFNLQIERK